MKTVKAQVPEGVRDVTGQEAFAKRALEQRLQTMFVRSGFEEIITPSLEYAELFEGEVGNLRQDRMIRLFEQDGKMMTLRPDFTMPGSPGCQLACKAEPAADPCILSWQRIWLGA